MEETRDGRRILVRQLRPSALDVSRSGEIEIILVLLAGWLAGLFHRLHEAALNRLQVSPRIDDERYGQHLLERREFGDFLVLRRRFRLLPAESRTFVSFVRI